ncbi:class I SAM-dependent methyltransferase [Nitrospirillum sp. BR 11163]|uniref:SAM-dependent methyltransferase n=1 Tax=Nitrospirillum sp. BR 11163 TaxID=3104323 RepID=UPI002AFFB3AC|nr:class I SAM-dependent methyltransferase [Nitrospirillum sp. BR 11163]MEA1671836.1 class I SAM-dependent methyltransferase [Nitrospirillum sp. BR 11163]
MAEALLQPAAFDRFADDYDAGFAHSIPGRWLRHAVWRQVGAHLRPGMRALDLGCGTGEDALWLAHAGAQVTAADGSPAMLRVTADKAARLGMADRVAIRQVDLNAPGDLGGPYDLVLSNFGALNCAMELTPLVQALRRAVAPGGVVAVVVMGRFCAWETLWHGARFSRTAVRRWSGRSSARIGDATIPIRYWTPGDIARAFTPAFEALSVHPVGVFLPPSDFFASLVRHPRRLTRLMRWEMRVGDRAALAGLADHHLTLLRHV